METVQLAVDGTVSQLEILTSHVVMRLCDYTRLVSGCVGHSRSSMAPERSAVFLGLAARSRK